MVLHSSRSHISDWNRLSTCDHGSYWSGNSEHLKRLRESITAHYCLVVADLVGNHGEDDPAPYWEYITNSSFNRGQGQDDPAPYWEYITNSSFNRGQDKMTLPPIWNI